MKIKWYGHACFLLTASDGTRILTDPFDEKVGYELPVLEAEIVTTSHEHYDHNNTGAVIGSYTRIKSPGCFNVRGIEIIGVSTFHDESRGSKRGKNIMFIYTVDGIRVCHCGDLGHMPTPDQLGELGEIDVLLVPVGGTYTIDAAGAAGVLEQLKPSVTIPMHFKTDALAFSLDGVNRFLAAAGGGEITGKQEIEVNRENLASFAKVIVLGYK